MQLSCLASLGLVLGLTVLSTTPALGQTEIDVETPDIEAGMGWLGVVLTEIPIEMATELGYTHTLIGVERVFPDSPAESSSFRDGDIIVAFNETELEGSQQLVELVGGSAPGTEILFTLFRDGEVLEQPVMLGLRPEFDTLLTDYFLDKVAPELVANQLLTDEHIELESYRGNVVLLDFWATWCGACRTILPQLTELQTELADQGLVVVGVSNEEPEILQEFLAENPVGITIGYDLNEESTGNFWVTAYPTIFLIDRDGVVRSIYIGTSQTGELHQRVIDLLNQAQ